MIFSELLLNEYIKKQKKNPKFSKRSFARILGIDASLLIKILANKRKPTSEILKKTISNLDLTIDEKNNFIESAKPFMKDLQGSINLLSLDSTTEYKWYFPILIHFIELRKPTFLQLETFFQALGISNNEILPSLNQLITLEIIENNNENWFAIKTKIDSSNPTSTSLNRKNTQKEYLQLAINRLDLPFDERECKTVTLTLNSKLMRKYKSKLHSFALDLLAESEKQSNLKKEMNLYNCSLVLVPIEISQKEF